MTKELIRDIAISAIGLVQSGNQLLGLPNGSTSNEDGVISILKVHYRRNYKAYNKAKTAPMGSEFCECIEQAKLSIEQSMAKELYRNIAHEQAIDLLSTVIRKEKV